MASNNATSSDTESDEETRRRHSRAGVGTPFGKRMTIRKGLLVHGTSLHQSAREGNANQIRKLIGDCGDNYTKVKQLLEEEDDSTLRPLHYAARGHHLEAVKVLVEAGAEVEPKGEDGNTPLIAASKAKFKSRKHLGDNGIETALSKESDFSLDDDGEEMPGGVPDSSEVIDQDEEGTTVITYLVLKKKADVNCENQYKQRPLHFAAMRGNEIVVENLLQCPHVDVDAEDDDEITPLHEACSHGATRIVEMLLDAGADLNCRSKETREAPIHHASKEGHFEIVKLLLKQAAAEDMLDEILMCRDFEGTTPLHQAVRNNHLQVAMLLLTNQADPNASKHTGETPLHAACLAADGSLKMADILMNHGADLTATTTLQQTALHLAASANDYLMTEYLINRGCLVDARDNDGGTPLLVAAKEGHDKIVSVLRSNGASVEACDKKEKSALFLAAENGHVKVCQNLLRSKRGTKLLEKGDRYKNAPLHVASERGYLEVVKTLLKAKPQVDAKNEDDLTALHRAASNGQARVVRELVRHSQLTLNDVDEESNTPLHLAALHGQTVVVKTLLHSGADIMSRNAFNWTPLDCAAAKGYSNTATILLDNGSPVDPIDKSKTTPLHLAAKSGHLDVVSVLISRGAHLDQVDKNGMNALDLAVASNRSSVAMEILQSKNWRHALYNVRTDDKTGRRMSPFRSMIQNMPEAALQVLDNCYYTDPEKQPDDPSYFITFNYEIVEDGYDLAAKSGGSFVTSVWNERGRLRPEAVPYSDDKELRQRDHPLSLMVQYGRENLLAHALVISLLRYKWNRLSRFLYYIGLMLYTIFVVLLTIYVIVTPPPYHRFPDMTYRDDNGTVLSGNKTPTCQPLDQFTPTQLALACRWSLVFVLIPLNLLREACQLAIRRLNYFNSGNLVELFVYIGSFVFLLPLSKTCYIMSWQWCLGAIVTSVAWFNLVLFLRKFPRFGIYVVMFTDIFRTFSRFSFILFLFMLSFSTAFFMLLRDQKPFYRMMPALVKTSVMTIGEMEFDAIFHGENRLHYEWVTYILFVIFMSVMTIIIMNLLVGLAVDDIKAVQDQARLKKLQMQVTLVLEVEMSLPESLRRGLIVKKQTLKPNLNSWYTRFSAWMWEEPSALSVRNIARTLHERVQSEDEKIQQTQREISERVSVMGSRVQDLASQNRRMQSKIDAIIKKLDVEWEDEDFD